MALESLLGKMEEAAARIRMLEREKNEASTRIQALEREATELRSIISQAEAKADEMLKGAADAPRSAAPKALSFVAPGSRGLEELVEPSPEDQEELKRRFPHAFTSA